MTAERREDHSADHEAALQWLDELSGRTRGGTASAEGQALHRVLQLSPPEAQDRDGAAWSDIERLAQAPRPPAANQSRYLRLAAWVGGCALVTALAWLALHGDPDEREGLRGEPATTPTWQVPEAGLASERLASELRELGAAASVTQAAAGGWLVRVVAPIGARDAVQRHLAAQELSLDGEGRLTLLVIDKGRTTK